GPTWKSTAPVPAITSMFPSTLKMRCSPTTIPTMARVGGRDSRNMVDGGFYGYPYDYRPTDPEQLSRWRSDRQSKPGYPYTLWRMEEYGGGSPTGAIAYNEDALPEEYRGNLFHCEWGKGNVERFVVARE